MDLDPGGNDDGGSFWYVDSGGSYGGSGCGGWLMIIFTLVIIAIAIAFAIARSERREERLRIFTDRCLVAHGHVVHLHQSVLCYSDDGRVIPVREDDLQE